MTYRWMMLAVLIVFAAFCLISVFHAYSFTHPIREHGWNFEPKNGMNLTIVEKAKAIIFGIRPMRGQSEDTPLQKNLKFEEVTFKSRDGLNISAWYIPTPNPKGIVMLVHGYYRNKASMIEYAKFLNKIGYDTLLIDLRGSGQSEGEYVSMGYYEKLDVLGAVDYVKNHSDYNNKKIFGFGISLGAASLVLAEEQEHSFNALILDGCYTNVYDNVATRFKKALGLPKFPFATALTLFGGIVLGVNGFEISPENSIKAVHIPVLVIQSSKDDSVLVEDGKRFFDHANEPKQFLIIEGAQHANGLITDPQKYENTVERFFEEALIQKSQSKSKTE